MATLVSEVTDDMPRGLSSETFALLMEIAPPVQDSAPDFLAAQAGQLCAGMTPQSIDRLGSLGFNPLLVLDMVDDDVDRTDHGTAEVVSATHPSGAMSQPPPVDAVSVTPPPPGAMSQPPPVALAHAVQMEMPALDLPALSALPSSVANVDAGPATAGNSNKSAAAGSVDGGPPAGGRLLWPSQPKLPYTTAGATTGTGLDAKAKRREQNRVNAARSRQRKQEVIQQLTFQLEASQKENEALRQAYVEMLRLRKENENLRDFVAAFRAASQGADPSAIASAAHQQGMVFTRQDPLFELGGLGHAGDISIDPSPLVQGSGDARARDRSFCAAAMAAPSPQQGMMSQDSFDLSLADFGECSTPTAPMATAFVLPDPPQ